MHTDLLFLPTGVALSGIDAAGGGVTVHGALTLTRAQPSQADLSVDVGPGAVLTQGHANARVILVETPGGANLDLALKATDVELRSGGLTASDVTLDAEGPVAHAPYRIAADVAWAGSPLHLQGGGVASELAQGYAATFEGSGRLRKAEFRTITPAQLSFGGRESGLQAALSLGAAGSIWTPIRPPERSMRPRSSPESTWRRSILTTQARSTPTSASTAATRRWAGRSLRN